eukprot:scaffold19821_cov166-Skeletonema_marinoi.AAC.11
MACGVRETKGRVQGSLHSGRPLKIVTSVVIPDWKSFGEPIFILSATYQPREEAGTETAAAQSFRGLYGSFLLRRYNALAGRKTRQARKIVAAGAADGGEAAANYHPPLSPQTEKNVSLPTNSAAALPKAPSMSS